MGNNSGFFVADLAFRTLVEQTLAGIYVIPKNLQNFSYVNLEFSKIFGYSSPDEIIGRVPITQFIAPSHRELVMNNIKLRFDGMAKDMRHCFTGQRKDGTNIELEVHGQLMEYLGEQAVIGLLVDITKCKQAEKELCENATRYHTLLDNLPQIVWQKDRDSVYVRCNAAFARSVGISAANLSGKTDYDFYPSEIADKYRSDDRRIIDSGETETLDERLLIGGKECLVHTTKVPLRNDEGSIYGTLGIAEDITNRIRAEKEICHLNQSLEQRINERTWELQVKEEQLREALTLNDNILMTSPVGIATYQGDGWCLMVNPAFTRMIGGSTEQLLKQNFRQLHSWRVSGLLDVAERVLASGTSKKVEVKLTSSFGRKIWVQSQFSRFISLGEPHLLLMMHDITETKLVEAALVEREREFHSLADNVPDNVIRTDCSGRVLFINKTLETTLGRTSAELIGKTADENFPDGRFSALDESMRRVGATGESAYLEQIFPRPDGELRSHLISIVAESGSDGKPVSVLAVGRDVTMEKKIEEELRLAASVFHNSAEGVLVTDADTVILSVNPAFTKITGYSEEDALGQKPSLLRSNHNEPEFYRLMWAALNGEGCWQGEIWNRRKSGEAYLEWLTINRIDDSSGTTVRYVAVFHDITELRQKDEHIRHLAFHDALTGLPNRALLHDRLQHALKRAQREGARLSVTFIDLDRFKAINDTLGHDVGDLLLQEVANRIKGRLRSADTVARMGGDEFVVLMEDLAEAGDCACLAQEIIDEIARPMSLNGHTIEIGASMGMAFYPGNGTDTIELMKCADIAMYAAKSAGRNTYRFFQQDMM